MESHCVAGDRGTETGKTLDAVIGQLSALRNVHGGDVRVLLNHSPVEVVKYCAAITGTEAEYISLESE